MSPRAEWARRAAARARSAAAASAPIRGTLVIPAGEALVAAVDTLVSGVHFLPGTAADDIGHKALAVNLSDLAAMGATPLGYSLALTVPSPDPDWIDGFDEGIGALARLYGVTRVAARLDPGPLAVTVETYGSVPAGLALRRTGASPGEAVYVSGTLGDAALALAALQGRASLTAQALTEVVPRLHRPQPRVPLGHALRGVASAAIDVSDGLAADLGHVLAASGVGACLELARLPLSAALAGALEPAAAWSLALGGGDDYELCFTAGADRAPELQAIATRAGCPVTRIGWVEAAPGLRCLDPSGTPRPAPPGFDHFERPAAAGPDP